ncbi:MAG: hypothetical protein M3403_05255, partial [Gemmatimonadota bacterium]|nr:hypothetical protein [Gemmatimonadota bacterium]
MRYYIGLLAAVLLVAGCNDKPPNFKTRSQMTQREKDSILGASSLPGAPVVSRALGAADISATRDAA